MTQDLFMHGLGVASLAVFAGSGAVAVATIVTHVGGQWHRIAAALRGKGGSTPAPHQIGRSARLFASQTTKAAEIA